LAPLDFDDLAAHAAGDLTQLALLVSRGLLDCRNAKVKNRAAHRALLLDIEGLEMAYWIDVDTGNFARVLPYTSLSARSPVFVAQRPKPTERCLDAA